MFMGDVGSQALGGALGVVALMTNQWLILPVIAIVPMATMLSTILAGSVFSLDRRQTAVQDGAIASPFELIGWSETQIVQRWWLLSILAAMVGIALALV